jgi:hypothetical protein
MLDIPAQPNAPIACDMRGAPDTAEERLEAYRALFATALLARERRPDAVVLRLRSEATATVEALARREAACCPFLSYRVEPDGDAITWTIGGDSTETLDAFDALAQGRRITLPA